MTYRRYEILLPKRYNDGEPVPMKLITDTIDELHERFGAGSVETQTIRGVWEHAETIYRDDMVRVFVDTEDDQVSRDYLVAYKEHLKDRFKQIDIWITTYPIEIL